MKEYKMNACLICNTNHKMIKYHIKSLHGLDYKSYIDTYINNNLLTICKLPECNKESKFNHSKGSYNEFCSRKCSMTMNHRDPVYAKRLSEKSTETITRQHKDPEWAKNNSLRSSIKMSKITRSDSFIIREKFTYINKALSKGVTKGIFYILMYEECFKIGICYFIDNDLRYFNHRLPNLFKYNKVHPLSYEIMYGNIIDVAELEASFKISYIPIKRTEYFSVDLYEEIKSKIPNTILPYSTLVV